MRWSLRPAAASVREAIKKVTTENIEDMMNLGVTAHEDARGAKWSLGAYAEMNCSTIGRAASSRAIIDSKPREVTIEVSGCSYCQEFEGTYPFGDIPGWPPFHPSCTCTASAA
jgi:hypothetical protein